MQTDHVVNGRTGLQKEAFVASALLGHKVEGREGPLDNAGAEEELLVQEWGQL